MLGRPVRPSVWEITGNVGLRARMRNWGGNWSLKIENCETSSLGKLKISRDLSYHEEKWQMFQKFTINARNRDKMVQSSLFHYAKCNHWAPKTGLQLKGGGEEGTNLRFAKAARCRRSSTVSVNLWKRGFVQHLHCRDSMYISWFLSFSMKTAQVGCRDKLLTISFFSFSFLFFFFQFQCPSACGLWNVHKIRIEKIAYPSYKE